MFTRSGSAVHLELEPLEREILDDLARQVVALLAPDDAPPADPIAAMVGIGTQTERPDDPALARLLPDAFLDDPAASAEFRRFTEVDLRARKVGDAEAVMADLAAASIAASTAASTADGTADDAQIIALDDDRARRWLGFLNDLRLVLGSRLAVTEEAVELDDDDPRLPAYAVYGWLGLLQETLVESLVPRHP